MKVKPTYECRLYMGSVNYATKQSYSQEEVELFCGKVQEEYKIVVPVRITPTTFVSETDYREKGWEIGVIDYPRLNFSKKQIHGFIIHLGKHLIQEFHQRTICIVESSSWFRRGKIIMLENKYG